MQCYNVADSLETKQKAKRNEIDISLMMRLSKIKAVEW